MSVAKMSTVTVLIIVCALAGLCRAEAKQCSMSQEVMLPKIMGCVATKISKLDYFNIFMRMEKPKSMESLDFICREQDLMTHLVECLLQYVEGCMPPAVAQQVTEVMPTHQTIHKGITFLCQHRQDFEDVCVKSRLTSVGQCIDSKMQTFSRISGAARSGNVKAAMCYVLQQEEQCVDSSLQGCPQQNIADIKSTLHLFFPSFDCANNRIDLATLLFQSENRH
ncbi:hypothetical protein ACOMHN_025121 [Nucella lapillus]